MDTELRRTLELSGIKVPEAVNESPSSTQSGLAIKVEAIMIGIVSEFPPEGDQDINIDKESIDNPHLDVAFRGTIGIPVINTTNVVRHQASYYGPEESDDHEEEATVDVGIILSTIIDDGVQYVGLQDREGEYYTTMPVTAPTDEIINQFVSEINNHKFGAEGSQRDFSSYKQAHAANKDGPY